MINNNNGRCRCVVVGGADIADYDLIRGYLRPDDYVIYCDSGLRHMEGLRADPSLIVGDFDSHENPCLDTETIVLPVAKDDTDTVYAVREGKKRGFTSFLLLGVFGARLDHTLVNAYILFDLDSCGMSAAAVDDYSEISVLSAENGDSSSVLREDVIPERGYPMGGPVSAGEGDKPNDEGRGSLGEAGMQGRAFVSSRYPYFSLLNMTGEAAGVTIRGAKFGLEDAEITSDYQYATSNEVLPGQTAEITIRRGRLLLIRDR